ncbi:MAG: porin [Candidatus Competibacteraceae bacterium]|nr:porin [Candidatus Competibacteraceae bacterium]
MQKSLLSLAVAAVLAAPLAVQADTILYGSARVSVDYVDPKLDAVSKFFGDPEPDSNWDVVNNSSRLGILGSEDLGGGLSAVYRYEFGVDVTEGDNFESNRPKFVGLRGNFGTLTIGTKDTPYYNVAGIVDTFNSSKTFGADAWLGGSFNGFKYNQELFSVGGSRGESTGLPSGDLFRLENSVYYITPEFNGFSAEAMLVLNGTPNGNTDPGFVNEPAYSDNIDIWNVAAKYSNGPFFAGVSYIKLDGNNVFTSGFFEDRGTQFFQSNKYDIDMDQWVLGLGYASGPFSVGLIYEQGNFNQNGFYGSQIKTIRRVDNGRVTAQYDVTPNSNSDAKNWYLTGSYAFGNNIIRAAYGQLDTGIDQFVATFNSRGPVDVVRVDDKIDNYLLGYQYNFSKRSLIWAEYIGRNADGYLWGDSNAFSIGTRVDF